MQKYIWKKGQEWTRQRCCSIIKMLQFMKFSLNCCPMPLIHQICSIGLKVLGQKEICDEWSGHCNSRDLSFAHLEEISYKKMITAMENWWSKCFSVKLKGECWKIENIEMKMFVSKLGHKLFKHSSYNMYPSIHNQFKFDL